MNYPQNSHLSNNASYNLQDVSTMCRGNNDQVLKMIELFIDQIPKFISEINTAFSDNNTVKIKKEVHKIKPTVHFFGAFKLEQQLLLMNESALDKLNTTELELTIKNCNLLAEEVINDLITDYKLTKN